MNTRARDFYDVFILGTTQTYDAALLKEAFTATAAHRGTTEQIADIPALLKLIQDSEELKLMWEKYRKDFSYAADVTYVKVIDAINNICKVFL